MYRETITHLRSPLPRLSPPTLEADVTLCQGTQGSLLVPLSWEVYAGSQSWTEDEVEGACPREPLPMGPEASRWERRGAKVLCCCLTHQVLPLGQHSGYSQQPSV